MKNGYLVLLLVYAVLGGCFCKRHSKKREAHTTNNTSVITTEKATTNFTDVIITNLSHSDSEANKTIKPSASEPSRIFVFVPTEEQTFSEQNLSFVRKIKALLLNFFTALEEQPEELDEVDHEEKAKIQRRDFVDFFEKAKESVVDTSKKVIKTTKDVAKAVKDNVKKITTRNASLFQTGDDDDVDVLDHESHICRENCTGPSELHKNSYSEEITNDENDSEDSNFDMTTKLGKVQDITSDVTAKKFLAEENRTNQTVVFTPSTHKSLKAIDKNTKYFFGELSTDAEPAAETHQTQAETNKSQTEKTSISFKHHKSSILTHPRKKKTTNLKKCKAKEKNCAENQTEKVISPMANDNVTTNNAATLADRKTSAEDNLNIKTTTKNNTHSMTKYPSFLDKNINTDPFGYNDRVWKHLEDFKSKRTKPNSTEDFFKTHHFLFNSGGTDKSTTAIASELNAHFLQNKTNKTNTEIKFNKLLLETEDLGKNSSLYQNLPLKRHRRIKRSKLNGPERLNPSRRIVRDIEEDPEITLPSGDEDNSVTSEKTTTPIVTTHNTIPEQNNKILSTTAETRTTLSKVKTVSPKIELTTSTTQRRTPPETQTISAIKQFTTSIVEQSITDTKSTKKNLIRQQPRKVTITSIFDKKSNKKAGSVVQVTDEDRLSKTLGKSSSFEKDYNQGGGIQTKPLLLLVTVPSFIGIGVFILLLCFLTRTGGWCCRLFEVQRASLAVASKDPQQPTASRYDKYY